MTLNEVKAIQDKAEADAQAARAARAPVGGSLADIEGATREPSTFDPSAPAAPARSARQFFEGLQAPAPALVATAPALVPVEQSSAATNASPAAAPAPVAAPVVSPKAAIQYSSGALREAPNSTPPTDRDDSGTRIEPSQGTAAPESHPVEAALAAQGVDPTVARMLADRARAQDELKGAQAEAERRRGVAQAEVTMLGINTHTPEAALRARLEAANAPVADVQARQKAAQESMAQSEAEQKFTSEATAANPGSQENKDFRDFVKTEMKINLPPNATMARFKPLAEMYQKEREGREKTAGELERTREQSAAHLKGIGIQQAGENRRHAEALAAKGAEDKPISDRVSIQLQGGQEMVEAAQEMRRLAGKTGVGAALTRGNVDNPDWDRAVEKASQAEAKAVHGSASEAAAKGFKDTYRSAYGTSKEAQLKQADELEARGRERVAGANKLLSSQGKRNIPMPEAASPQAAPTRAGWEHMPDGSRYPVDAKGNRIGPAVR